jgi:hypothetical protein
MTASVKVAVFWVVVRILARGLFIALMMYSANTTETSVNFYQTTRRNNPEDSHLQQVTFLYSFIIM